MTRARLVLEDGTVFSGRAFGKPGEVGGEIVFNTSMTGYQEILTDPSYCGQIVTMTYPLIGNYGVNSQDFIGEKPFARGMIVREYCRQPSNWRCQGDLDSFMKEYGLMGLEAVDTRALTKKLRSQGTMRGLLTISDENDQALIERARNLPGLSGQRFVSLVATKQQTVIPGDGPRVVVVDFGDHANITAALSQLGCEVIVVPPDTEAQVISGLTPLGVVLANGPGDPKDNPESVAIISNLLSRYPIFGIGLGHQLLGLALGGDTYKLPFGHRGSNQPVQDLRTDKVYITRQNHGFAVDERSLDENTVIVSHRNVNDQTVEGLRHRTLPLFSLQYQPEAGPGPMDAVSYFREFLEAGS